MTQPLDAAGLNEVISALEHWSLYKPGQKDFVQHVTTGLRYAAGERNSGGARAIEATLVWYRENFGHLSN